MAAEFSTPEFIAPLRHGQIELVEECFSMADDIVAGRAYFAADPNAIPAKQSN